jgi:hypothetical protein
MSSLSYCKGWFRDKKESLASYTTEQARARHESGELYCALVGSAEAPRAFLEVVKGLIGVSFLDGKLRERLSYSFQEVEPGRIFLTRATWREYVGSSDQVANGTTHLFKFVGELVIYREVFVPSYSSTYSESRADVSANWEVTPPFGQYSDLLRVERVG